MRNIDKIKALKREIEAITMDRNRYKDLAQKKHDEVSRLNAEREKLNEGIRQTQQAADIIVITCAVMFGEETEIGYKLALPRSMDGHNLQAFNLKTRGISSDDNEMIFEAVEKAKVEALGKKAKETADN